MVNIGIIGVGNWGKNLVRNFAQLPDCNLCLCCDTNTSLLNKIKTDYPGTNVTENSDDVINDKNIDAVVIAAPAVQHYSMAKKVLLQNKHVFVEKPLTLKCSETEELIDIAAKKNKKLMVGHLMLYHPAIQKLKDLIDDGTIGDVYYIISQRLNFGRIRTDENVLWSFAPHDLSIIYYLLGVEPDNISARGECYVQDGVEDVAFVNLHFEDRKMAEIQLSWLAPHKVRKLTIVGSKKMVFFDDMEPTEKIKIYDKGAAKADYDSFSGWIGLRQGDIHIPYFQTAEPLRIECQHFIDCIQKNEQPYTDGQNGLQVVKSLEAAQKSLKQNGVPVQLA